MDLNAKIQQILINKELSSSQFADAIGVTRSGISHILSGRNRPSLDLVQKIIIQYPELGTAWILDSEPLPTIRPDINGDDSTDVPDRNYKERDDNTKGESNPVNTIPDKVTPLNTEAFVASGKEAKVMERVLVFFTNGTFKEYLPM